MSQGGVAQSNDRLFKVYEKNLRRPVIKEYAETAIKLSAWLSNAKAYYAAARPSIVNLLITAQTTLRQAVKHAMDSQVLFLPTTFLHHPLALSYVRLVISIRPFRELFIEPHLQEAITHLLQSIEGISIEDVSPSLPQDPLTNHPLPASSPTSYNVTEEIELPGVPEVVSPPKRLTSTMDQITVPVSYPQPDLHAQGQEFLSQTTVFPGTPTEGAERSPSSEIAYVGASRKEPTRSIVQKAIISSALKSLPVHDESRPTGKNKSKKKKKKNLSAFVQSDLQDFERRQQAQQARKQTSVDSVVFIKREPEVEQVPLAAHDVQQNHSLAFDGAQDRGSATSVSPGHTQPITLPERDAIGYVLPTRTPAYTGNSQTKVPSTGPTASRPLAGQATEPQSTSSADQTLEKDTDTVLQKPQNNGPQGPNYIPPPSSTELSSPSVLPEREQHSEVPAIPVSQLTGLVSPTAVGPASGLSEHFPAESLVVQEQKSEETSVPGVRAILPFVSPGTKPQAPKVQNKNVTNSSADFMPRPLLISEDSDLGRLFKWYEEYKTTQPRASGSTKDVEKTLQAETEEINTAAGLADDVAALDLQTQMPNKFLHIVALSPGRPSGANHEFTFDVMDSDMRPLSKWINRSLVRLSELASSSYCLSLGCYSSLEVGKLIGSKLKATPDAIDSILTSIVQSLSSTWPQAGGLYMNVNFTGDNKDLPLSPPIVVTGDGLVDVSEFMVLGRNSLQVRQQDKDFSGCIFILQAHRPTLSQLQEVISNRRKEVEWKDWLVKMTGPLRINTQSTLQSEISSAL